MAGSFTSRPLWRLSSRRGWRREVRKVLALAEIERAYFERFGRRGGFESKRVRVEVRCDA